MKWILIASLAANLALAGVVLERKRPANRTNATAIGPTSAGSAQAFNANTGVGPTPSIPFWDSLPTDPELMTARLKSAGLPIDIIRSILKARLEQRREAARIEFEKIAPPRPYWQAFVSDAWVRSKLRTDFDLRQMGQENDRIVARLTGQTEDFSTAFLRRLFGDLPEDKLVRLMQVKVDADELARLATERLQIARLPSDVELLRTLARAREEDFRAILTPEEYETFQLRAINDTTEKIRMLPDFQPTEEEYKTIFSLQRSFDLQFEVPLVGSIPDSTGYREYHSAKKRLVAGISQALGPVRGLEYERAVDPTTLQMMQIGAEAQLPRDSLIEAWRIQRDIQSRADLIRQSPGGIGANLPQMRTLQAEARGQLSRILGPHGFQLYQQRLGGWISLLNPGQIPASPQDGP